MTTVAAFVIYITFLVQTLFLVSISSQGCTGSTDPGMAGSYVPKCDSQGNYIAEQCQGGTGYCWCVTSSGEEIPNTRWPPGGQRKNCIAERRGYYGGNNNNMNNNNNNNYYNNNNNVARGMCPDSNSQFQQCAPVCEETCYGKPADCNSACVPGCTCNPGYVRQSTSQTSPCVPRSQCTNTGTTGNQQQCSSNEVYSQCPPQCEESCAGMPQDCGIFGGTGSGCTPGCTCRPGYVRQGANNVSPCIPRSQCTGPGVTPGPGNQGQCTYPNEVYQQCTPPCEDSCYGKPRDCGGMGSSNCRPGCACRPGYVRQEATAMSPCVLQSQCGGDTNNPNYPTPNQNQCTDPNSQFSSCGSACPETCQGKPTMCTMQCVQGCFCKNGYVKQSSTPSSLCVLQSQCMTGGNNYCPGGNCVIPNPNPNPNPYPTCRGSNCITNPNVQYPTPNCPGGNCVTNNPYPTCTGSNCNNGGGSCSDPNSEYKTCGTACPDSCQGSSTMCTMQCVQGCFCKTGYIKETSSPNSRCVRRDQCNSYVQPPTTGNNVCSDPNSEFSQCGSSCPANCQQRNTVCGYQCVQGCFCKPGFLKLTSANNAPCVQTNRCNSYAGLRLFRFF